MRYYIERPKTKSGERYVPVSEEVKECFKAILEKTCQPALSSPSLTG